MRSPKLQILVRFLSVFGRSPLRTSKYLTMALFQQITSIVENPDGLSSLTDSQRAKAWQRIAPEIISLHRPRSPAPHGLPEQLTVSLTSYPPRFPMLPLTLRSLLAQTRKADRIVLWIAHEDEERLTREILDLQDEGLRIRFCPDLGPYKKIIPTLQSYPGGFIATADDDIYYWPTWLEELVETWGGRHDEIIAHRVRQIQLDEHGRPLPYNQWPLDATSSQIPTPFNFATGIAGVLYPPGAFHEQVTDIERFQKVCAKADDIWLYWMARLNGSMVKRTPSAAPAVTWPGTQRSALFKKNVAHGNDDFIRSMIAAYGFPDTGLQGVLPSTGLPDTSEVARSQSARPPLHSGRSS